MGIYVSDGVPHVYKQTCPDCADGTVRIDIPGQCCGHCKPGMWIQVKSKKINRHVSNTLDVSLSLELLFFWLFLSCCS